MKPIPLKQVEYLSTKRRSEVIKEHLLIWSAIIFGFVLAVAFVLSVDHFIQKVVQK